MVLLLIKSGQDYIRIKDDEYLLSDMDKASVFPLNQINVVKSHVDQLNNLSFTDICVKKLVISEEDFAL
ncbi:MAG: hypothetical protein GY729_07740 [Desulfobacteraceae bacterium]|nr:hypothetical protein [Desulfobacteraceae bacterium]